MFSSSIFAHVKWILENYRSNFLPFKSVSSPLGVLHAAAAKSLQSCPTLCNLIDGGPPGSPAPGIFQARVLEWGAIASPMHESESESEVAHSCPTLHDHMGCSPPGSPVHGIFQARVLEWGAIAFSQFSMKPP